MEERATLREVRDDEPEAEAGDERPHGELALLKAILDNAIRSLRVKSRDGVLRREALEAWDWILDDSENCGSEGFTFLACCRYLERDPERIRYFVMRQYRAAYEAWEIDRKMAHEELSRLKRAFREWDYAVLTGRELRMIANQVVRLLAPDRRKEKPSGAE